MKIKLNRKLRQEISGISIFYSILSIIPLLFGCKSLPNQNTPSSSNFTYNGIGYPYAKKVFDVYSRAWEPGTNIVIDNPITKATVTIAKDGEVVSAKIFKLSGDEQMDISVQKTLDEVKFVQPFENDSKDVARTFTVNFDLNAKKLSKDTSIAVSVSNEIHSQEETITPFNQYDTVFRNSITKSWYALLDKQKFVQPKTSKVVLQFHLTYDGQITDMKVLENSAGDALALICQKAVLASVPYKPWPEDMIRMVGANYREMTFTFNYW
jgi:hypothetical protein